MGSENKIAIEVEMDDGSIKKAYAYLGKETETVTKKIATDFDKASKGVNDLASNVSLLIKGFLAFKGVQILVNELGKSIKEAAEADANINKLNTALALTGHYSKETTAQLQNFATEIQRTTKFSDDAVISSMALIQQLARLDSEGLQRATKAALDLSTAIGVDLSTASQIISRAANGNVMALNKLGIQIQKSNDNAVTFERTLQALESRFGGAALSSVNTFIGAQTQLENALSDLREEMGRMVTQSPAIIATIQVIAKAFGQIGDAIRTSANGNDLFKPIIMNLALLSQAGIATFQQIVSSIEITVRSIQVLGQYIVAVTTLFSGRATDNLIYFKEQLLEAVKAMDGSKNGAAIKFFDDIIMKVQETSGKLTEFGALDASIKNNSKLSTDALIQSQYEYINILTLGQYTLASVAETSEMEFKRMEQAGIACGQAISQGLVQLVSKGIQMLVTNLMKGKLSFKDFSKFILATMGDMAIQVGQIMLTTGIGMLALKGLDPATAIMAGAGLIALGSILKASMSGGDSNMGTAGVAEGGAPGTIGGPTQALPETDEQKPQNVINFTVQGDVLDSNESSLRFFELLKDYTDKNGNTVLVT